MIAFAALVFAVTVTTAAMSLFRQQQLMEQDPSFDRVMLWQAIVYGLWVPVAVMVWRWFGRSRLTPRAIMRFLLVGLVAIPVHAIGATVIDISFSRPGGADLVALAIERLQVDMLIYCGLGLLAVAGEFHRRAREEALVAETLKQALDAAGRGEPGEGAPPERLMVSTGSRRALVPIDEVEWFGSAGNYVVVNWQGREGLIRQTLKSLEERLDDRRFARSHRTAIVNLAKVQAAEPLADGSWRLSMASGGELIASRTHRDTIIARLRQPDVRPA